MPLPIVGNMVPDFCLLDQNEKEIRLSDFQGKSSVLLYFYPKALTPGCTVQACGIRDRAADFAELNTVVLGISPDKSVKLRSFDKKHSLNFTLLSDPDHLIAEAYGVWGLKKFMGREFLGVLRTSFLIDQRGSLVRIFDKVNTKKHDDLVISYMRSTL